MSLCGKCKGRGWHYPIRGIGEVECRVCKGTGIRTASRPKPRPIQTTPASPAQREAVAGQACRGCGKIADKFRLIDPAHVTPRGLGGCDDPLCCAPLCRTKTGGCHRAYDDGELDLLPKLSLEEQAHAVSHLGILGALHQITGERYEAVGKVAA